MSSPPKELKAGHPPAVKAGGMRVAAKRAPADTGVAAEAAVDIPPEELAEAPVDTGPLIISGYETKGDKDFQKEAIKAYHDKPQPAHENRPAASKGSTRHQIHQPQRRE